jgi:isoleucyl-tRNA synthetase
VLKDRLYCDAPDSPRRRSSQTVLADIARSTIAALAPIIPFTADEAWRYLPGTSGSVFLEGELKAPPIEADDERLLEAGRAFAGVRVAVNAALEPLIKDKTLPHRREAEVTLGLPAKVQEQIAVVCDDLAEGLAVAKVSTHEAAQTEVALARTQATRCERCWRHRPDVGTSRPDLCERCIAVLAAEPNA